jgi:hypothetical protein
MTRDDIIRMAQEAGFENPIRTHHGTSIVLPWAMFERFAANVAAAEREECAKVCEDVAALHQEHQQSDRAHGADTCADAIRARSKA